MKQALPENKDIILCETGTYKQYCFKILNIIGMGASCIVYTASYTDAEGNTFTVRLKEFYPSGLEITRNSAMELVVPDKYNDNFEKYTQRFTDGYRRQLKFRQNPENMNSISNIQGIFEGNNTKYTAMTCQNGISIDEADLSLYDIFRVLKAVTVQIDNFHKNNFLYLDLKPENVILYPETPELVMLFDFDSAVEIHELSRENLSFTQKWSAPETVQKKMKNIDVRSDVYTLGALLMYMLLERNPELTDRRRNADWTDEFQNSLLADESPETKRMIADIFRKTLSANPDSRYSSCSELLEVIEPFIQSFQKQKPYLKTVLPIGNNYFCGRDREISEIHNILESETSFLFLHGIGGIGKSELAKHYAIKYSDSYDAVIFVRYNGSIIETVASDSGFPVVNCNRCDDESDEEYFKRKISILQKICTPRHLVILDNFDTDECDNLDELTSLNCKFLITSRVDFEGIFPQYEVDVLDEFEDIYNIFSYWYRNEIPENEKQSAEDIITALQGHTMAVELVSKQMFLNDIKPVEMYKKLAENGMYRSSSGKIKEFKDGRLRNDTAYSHIETLFNIFELNETEKNVLSNLALIGPTLITLDYLDEIC
ncbi:MAG: protein kinase, partial [Porcipelethomonas sp.]